MSNPLNEKLFSKLEILADAAKYDASCSSSGGSRKRDPLGLGNSSKTGICHSYAPDGRCISLLKILLTNYCIYDCKYCVNRVTNDTPRARFSVEEVVELTLEFYRRNYIEGLFLSSGIIKSSDDTMELLIAVAKTLRLKHRFNGYIHLKLVAGASEALTQKAGLWADRVSANIEMPIQQDLDQLAPAKTIEEVHTTMNQVQAKIVETKQDRKKIKSTPVFAPAGQTTQMVIGATPITDGLILHRSQALYQGHALRRVYYSAYTPIPKADQLLPSQRPALMREHRLYQADWLMRFYGFGAQEIIQDPKQNLSLEVDPKTAWALANRHFFPVDVNRAPKEVLLRIPGIGVRNVLRILNQRRHRKISLYDLKLLGANLNRAKFFIQTSDHNPDLNLLERQALPTLLHTKHTQLDLFEQTVGGEM